MPREITPESHPRLLRLMQQQAILSESEACDALQAVRERRGSCEAVQHYGGPFAVFADSVRRRGVWRRLGAR